MPGVAGDAPDGLVAHWPAELAAVVQVERKVLVSQTELEGARERNGFEGAARTVGLHQHIAQYADFIVVIFKKKMLLLWELSFAVLLAEQVVDGFDGVEGGYRHLDKEGDPVGHSTVPQAG